jgi:type VI secretion system protein VasD
VKRRRLLTGSAAGLVPVFLLPALLPGCAGPPPPATLDLMIRAGADQNPDARGKPAAVAVHMMQLAATAKFERADVFALIEREKAALGTDLLASEEFVVAPGEQRTIKRQLKSGVQFIGVVVLFRDIDRARWRGLAPVATSGPSQLALGTRGVVASLNAG